MEFLKLHCSFQLWYFTSAKQIPCSSPVSEPGLSPLKTRIKSVFHLSSVQWQCFEQKLPWVVGQILLKYYSSKIFWLIKKDQWIERDKKNKREQEGHRRIRERKSIFIFSNRYWIRDYKSLLNFFVYEVVCITFCILMEAFCGIHLLKKELS